ncbi:MAG: hypothetical protein A3G20_04490 [Acidobacteria bacterium RIFCSPLOWO2_12_FULL_59_11]|nr:MAG: hypothetical protein A3G20_04490 [Acidobacteria bacterium RIFCSPLOWO2_12_FULL_59_11]
MPCQSWDTANQTLEKRLWAAADQFRANSGLKAGEYSGPVLGLIFLRFAEAGRPRHGRAPAAHARHQLPFTARPRLLVQRHVPEDPAAAASPRSPRSPATPPPGTTFRIVLLLVALVGAAIIARS